MSESSYTEEEIIIKTSESKMDQSPLLLINWNLRKELVNYLINLTVLFLDSSNSDELTQKNNSMINKLLNLEIKPDGCENCANQLEQLEEFFNQNEDENNLVNREVWMKINEELNGKFENLTKQLKDELKEELSDELQNEIDSKVTTLSSKLIEKTEANHKFISLAIEKIDEELTKNHDELKAKIEDSTSLKDEREFEFRINDVKKILEPKRFISDWVKIRNLSWRMVINFTFSSSIKKVTFSLECNYTDLITSAYGASLEIRVFDHSNSSYSSLANPVYVQVSQSNYIIQLDTCDSLFSRFDNTDYLKDDFMIFQARIKVDEPVSK